MKALLLLTLAYFAEGRPQYNYDRPVGQPSGSYGTPRFSISGGVNTQNSNNFGISGGIGQLPGGGFGGNLGVSQSGSFGISGHGSVNTGSGISTIGTGISSGGTGVGTGIGHGTDTGLVSGIGTGVSTGGITSGGGGSFGLEALAGGHNLGGGQTIVQKHIYVHVAPPEPEEERATQLLTAGPVQKHYKIIFIKAPTPAISPASVIASQQRSEEKTLIYVLVKKPESAEDIVLPTSAPTPPSKPEVYFIRYKANKQVGGGGVSSSGISAGGVIGGGASGSVISTGGSSSSSAISGTGTPATSYGPPGQSGPY